MVTYNEYQKEEITALLVGHKVTKVSADTLTMDDGRVLQFLGNEGGCSCGAGDYDLEELNDVDNIITSVEFYDNPDGDGWDGDGVYQIFVYADNTRVNLAKFEGSDGNGYYGTGYQIHVTGEVRK